jgi:biotin-[acetyl-CoA-carboxylase] ligase BirA-like protein
MPLTDPNPTPNHQPEHWVRAHLSSTGSTNRDALELARQHPGRVVLVQADTQHAGRGQAGRAWASPAGGAWFSVAVPLSLVGLENLTAAPLVAGLAVAVTLNGMLTGDAHGPARIKWPNDLLLGGRKTAGLLCEIAAPDPTRDRRVLIVGVGINVNIAAQDLPTGLRYPATSLLTHTGKAWPINQIINQCAARIVGNIDTLENEGMTAALKHEIESHMAWLDESVQVNPIITQETGDSDSKASAPLQGRLLGIDDHGRLRVNIAGVNRTFDVGEIRLAAGGSGE